MLAVTCTCQLPVYSHSIVNKPFFDFDINKLLIDVGGNVMKNTMLRNSCAGIAQDHGQTAVDVKGE